MVRFSRRGLHPQDVGTDGPRMQLNVVAVSSRDDDDINDVASMAGVNLSEESARILATNSELVGTQIRSCKDEAFLPTGTLHRRILETGMRFTEGPTAESRCTAIA